MVRDRFVALAFGGLGMLASAAFAADIPLRGSTSDDAPPATFFVHVGPAGVILDESATMRAAGQPVVGANISVKSQLTLAVEAGYFVTPDIAVSFTGGFPPNAKIEAAGTLNGLGRVGATTYGPMTLTAHYHFMNLGRLQPYVGFGPAFMYVFDDKDGAMSRLHINNTVGVALQAGADLMITDRWGVFVDVKKAFLRTEATGYLGPAPVKAQVTLDPLVLHTGLNLRF